jgi:hypothetical protein
VERACRHNLGEQVSTMVDALVRAFVDAKMERADISMALFAVATGREEVALVRKVGQRAQRALTSMLSTASDAHKDGALGATAARPALPRLPDDCREIVTRHDLAI